MVSSSHEAMHRIFRQEPGLFARVARKLDIPAFGTPISVTELPTDLTENHPVERRVDTLLQIEEAGGSYVLAVEAQGKPNDSKHATWAYYMTFAQEKYKLPPLLLVICKNQRTADWAARPVKFGPPQWQGLALRPLVIGPRDIPAVESLDEATRDVPMAVLSAILHSEERSVDGTLKVLAAALKAMEARDPDRAGLFEEFTNQGLDKTKAFEIWRQLLATETSFFTSSLSQELRAEGEARGEIRRATTNLLELLEGRGIPVSDADREQITSCDDLDTLGRWFRRAITATSTTEVLA
ncbi:hypothetical protein [Streptomyces sp. NBC_00576]|uniref:hypothetical protein n=1 Tax=Streptomyces sp. NBC_00576 TaxID=2903665 RepID=UPI002E801E4E|nr:hypothetical protein [Streptomyces sp. NBC_00576]WUB71934.1 hypothetical protein OG734_18525 [Streptomyces sp. NBC_00576]